MLPAWKVELLLHDHPYVTQEKTEARCSWNFKALHVCVRAACRSLRFLWQERTPSKDDAVGEDGFIRGSYS